MEILAPVKNYDNARVAINSGADAIYCAPPLFGARVHAAISLEELAKIIKLANCYHVKVYLTFNTVIFDDELIDFYELLDQVYVMGADGILIQDPSFIDEIKGHYPDLEVHASTQMNIHNIDAINLVTAMGVNRVVLPREMGIKRIKTIKQQTDCEIEVFGHGALCVSYSGLCFDSTLLDQKSANRGRCSQYCRMEQEIIHRPTQKVIRTGHPLNLKDLNTTSVFSEYQDAGIDSFKIEGRLKQPEYVMVNTLNYQLLNHNQPIMVDPTKVYNRLFTTGRIMGNNGKSIVNLNRPNNNGYYLGVVESISPVNDHKYNYYQSKMIIRSNDVINKLDNLRFVNPQTFVEDGQIVDVVQQLDDDRYLIYTNLTVNVGDEVYRTGDNKLQEATKVLMNTYLRREVIDVYIDIDNRYFMLHDHSYPFELITLEAGDITDETIIVDKLSKTKHTMFDLNVTLNYSNDLNILQKSLKQLKNLIIKTYVEQYCFKHRQSNPLQVKDYQLTCTNTMPKFYFEVRNQAQYEAIRSVFSGIVIVNNIELATTLDPHPHDWLMIPRVVYDDQYHPYDLIVKRFAGVVVSEYGAIKHYEELPKISNFSLNTTNSNNLSWLINLGLEQVYLSVELNYEKLSSMASDQAIVGIYGRIPVMMMDYCPINPNKTDTCGNCHACHHGDYYLHDKLNREFPLLYEGNYRIGMYANQPLSVVDELDKLQSLGFSNFYVSFSFETKEEVLTIYEHINTHQPLANTNRGSYYKSVL